ncbi:MAG: SpoIID/LytB domain-containing protein [Proteobacteria bacterium]|nr:SpoIID/LytB domain-containing protein [Pseudomonadota bacterium]
MQCSIRAWIACAIGAVSMMPGTVLAQNTELTSQDNHALLYAHQLGFSSSGTPTVRMRIADGLENLKFFPNGDFTVRPSGTGGCTIRLKGGRTYEISLSSPKPGKYQYGIIAARGETPASLETAKNACAEQKIDTEIVPIGSVFALHGHVFDNRENLLMTKRTSDKAEAKSLMSRVPADVSMDSSELYQEVLEYPTADISLRDMTGSVRVDNPNLLWIELPESGANLYGIEDESGKESDLLVNSQLIITPDSTGHMAVVQSADVETILRGIVPSEVYASAPEAALMAQAVAARTTLIAQVGVRHSADPYHLCNKQHCQVYRGLSGADPRTDKAIQKTRGEVLFSENKLVQSYYSAHCGGISAGSLETWGMPEKPYLVSRTDSEKEAARRFASDDAFMQWWNKQEQTFCGAAPAGHKPFASTKYARWTQTFSGQELSALLKDRGHDVGKVQKIEVLSRGESYRVTRIRVTGSKGKVEVERELSVRRLFGGLKSALFVMEQKKSGNDLASVTFYGAGFGHGVGLCQTGAIGMAQGGKNYKEILKHYYPGTHVDKLW